MSDSLQRSIPAILLEATQRQRIASDPLVSSWVGASAGSGKTKVLTDRMLRLLLPREDGRPGTAPQKILALTFTKAAANEMALRLSKKLSQWAVMEDADLTRELETLFGRAPKGEEIQSARKLFARVVDAPGGLNIMTIHSFCQSVLGRFPIEAGLPPHFKPLEEEESRDLLDEARRYILSNAGTKDGSPLQTAIGNISTRMTEEAFTGLLKAVIAERGQMESVLKHTFGIEGLYTRACTVLGIRPGLTASESFADFCAGGDHTGLRTACAALAEGSKTDGEKAIGIQAFWDEAGDKTHLYADYKSIFITSGGTVAKKLATQKPADRHPELISVLTAEAERILAFENEKNAIACAETTRDLLLIGQAVLHGYQLLKEERGAVDFDDLILKTLSLLKGEVNSLKGLKVTPWVLYKLDEGLDHILVDEAQDTNPEQWEIIRALSDDFFSGEGAADDLRTLFVVGDKKQSIFSFQRAAPEKFEDMYRWFDKKIREAGCGFAPVDINTSFRSVRTVLDAVDAVFAPARNLMAGYPTHIAQREGQPGLVELWPLFETAQDMEEGQNDTPETAGWALPDRLVESESGSARMASKIGDTIKSWLDQKTSLDSYDRPIRAGDIMVLVRARNAFVNQLVRALKKRKIPVSGVDRMVLGEQLAVQDLCAAARFALLPDDSLTLASLLKSPFIGMDEDALYALARGRPSTLWYSLKKNGDGLIVSWLEKLIVQAGSLHPYEFFSRLVQEPCPADGASGMRAIRRRLGDDALDPLDEFLNLTLDYQSGHGGGLQSFLHWHEQGSSEIKRQMEEAGGAVRIMTVHGAKGLQAPIVFLPDTVRVKSPDLDKILWPNRTGLDVPLYLSSRETTPQAAAQARTDVERQMDDEYRRLLYVAMTRAEERLYIGGYINKRGPSQNGRTAYWYDDIRSALEAHPDIRREKSGVADKDGNDQPLLRLAAAASAGPDKAHKKNETHKDTIATALPAWAFKPAPAEPFPPRPLAPSRPSEPEPAAASPLAESQAHRFRRGNAAHRLLQTLPDLPHAAQRAAAEKFLARPALGLPPQMQKSIADEVMAILEDKTFGSIFGPGSMAEIPVTGFLNGKTLISGQIDRVLITGEDILIVDFKTNRPPPDNAKDVPPAYLRQMKIYADLMREIYPGRTVRTALLWTDGARLMEIDNA
ncbi:MAG TPA: double-strand break repair helicase AddA [Micavibrio sp.]|nr:double-strand break repair helicase AddA [Micavibrio sp.]